MKSIKLASLFVGAMALIVFLSPFSVCQNSTKEPNGTPAGWSDDLNLSNDQNYRDVLPQIAVNGNNVHVVWLHNYQDVYYSKSIDGGISWSIPTNLFHSILSVDWPVIGANGNIIHVSWSYWNDSSSLHEVLYRDSTDNGDTWNALKRISNITAFYAGGPRIFVNGSNVHIIWYDQRDGNDGEIYYRRSLDSGITWDNGQGINKDRRITFSPATISSIQIAGNNSNISIIWTDERDGDWEIFWMISKDNGYTWEDGLGNQYIDRKLSIDASDSISPTVAMSGPMVHVVWADMAYPGPFYRLYYRNSTDNGVSWNQIQLLSGPVSLMNRPDIKANDCNISVVWQDKRDDGIHGQIYYKNSTNGGINWSSDNRITYNLTRDSATPKISLYFETIYLVRVDGYSGDTEVVYKRYPDFPDATPPSHSNEIPIPDSYKDAPGTDISVHVTDTSGVNESTIQLWVNGSLVSHISTPITDGYNVSWVSGGFSPGVVTCRIVAEDMLGNVLDYTWNFTVLAAFNIPLSPGWNLVSLPLWQVDNSPQSILDSIEGQYDVIKYYDTLDIYDPWKSYRPGGTVNDLAGLDNTMGFWLHATEACNLTVSGVIPSSTQINLHAGWNLVGYPSQTSDTVANALWGTGADRMEVFQPVSPFIREVEAMYVMKPGEGYWVHVPADTVWCVIW